MVRNGCDHPGHKGASPLKNASKNVTDLLLILILVEKVFSLHFMFEVRGRVQVFILCFRLDLHISEKGDAIFLRKKTHFF